MIGWSLGLLFIALCSRHARQWVVSCWRWLRLVSSDLRLQCKDQLFNDLLRVMYVSRMTFYCSFLKQIFITAKLSNRYLARNIWNKGRLFRIQHLLRGNGLKILIRRLAKLPDNYTYAQKNKIRRHWQPKTIPDLSSLLQLVFVRWLKTNKSLRFNSSVCRLWKRHVLRYQDEFTTLSSFSLSSTTLVEIVETLHGTLLVAPSQSWQWLVFEHSLAKLFVRGAGYRVVRCQVFQRLMAEVVDPFEFKTNLQGQITYNLLLRFYTVTIYFALC